MDKIIKKIESLLLNGSKEVYVCKWCNSCNTTNILFENKDKLKCCPECYISYPFIFNWVDFLTKKEFILNHIKFAK